MGLFTNNKKLCPICGNPTPRLLPTKIEDQPICKECDKKIDLPDGSEKNMTLDDFRQYLTRYEENQSLQSIFNETYRYGVFAHESLLLDEEHGLIRLKGNKGSWAIEKKDLRSFRICEDNAPIFESGDGAFKSYESEIPGYVEALRPAIDQFYYEKREYERRERMEELRNANEPEEARREQRRISELYRPHFEQTNVFKGFRLELVFDHPYWTFFELWRDAPTLDEDNPSAEDFLKEYFEKTEELHTLTERLMKMMDPNAGELRNGAEEAPTVSGGAAVQVDAVAEIKKYKELLDQGLITEEEFTLKKRQLMGI